MRYFSTKSIAEVKIDQVDRIDSFIAKRNVIVFDFRTPDAEMLSSFKVP